MNLIGKILVVLQVALSICFMAFAGAVYTSQTKWKTAYDSQTSALQTAQSEFQNEQESFEQQVTALTTELETQTQRADDLQGKNGKLQADIQRLENDVQQANIERTRQRALAEIAGEEANTRNDEARKMRAMNEALHKQVSELTDQVRLLDDRLYTQQRINKETKQKYDSLLAQAATLREELRRNELEDDPEKLARRATPPPVVEGVVLATRQSKENGSELVEITLGSDDGLAYGHSLYVYRPSGKGKYLGQISIVHLEPDRAVGRVDPLTKNGVIERGDNVTTRL